MTVMALGCLAAGTGAVAEIRRANRRHRVQTFAGLDARHPCMGLGGGSTISAAHGSGAVWIGPPFIQIETILVHASRRDGIDQAIAIGPLDPWL